MYVNDGFFCYCTLFIALRMRWDARNAGFDGKMVDFTRIGWIVFAFSLREGLLDEI